MSTGTIRSPNLPIAPVEYSQQYQDQLNNVLRLYFSQIDNPGISAASGLILNVDKMPTQVDLANIASGTVYIDTANANVLKVKI